MKDGAMKRCFAMGAIVAMYGIYMVTTPDPADGVIFATVMGAICGLAGYDLALRKVKDV